MSYLTETRTSNRNYVLIGVAVIIHLVLGYALVTGLAYKAIKHIVEPIETVNVKEEKPPEEKPPPPPEKLQDIPVVTPPPDVQVQQQQTAPTITTVVTNARPVAPPTVSYQPPPPVVTAPPPPKPLVAASPAVLRGDHAKLISTDDYPEASLRAEEQGTTRVSYDINEQGRVENCQVTQSSGHPRLDQTTCTLMTRRFKFTPAKAEGGTPMRVTGHPDAVRWVVPPQ